MPDQGYKGFTRLIKATGWSLQGLRFAFLGEAAFRQECALFVVFAPLGLWLGRTGIERALLVGSLFLVLVVELVNTAIEVVVDRVGKEHHELSGRAKDVGSAAVLLSLANAVLVWVLVLTG